ncbi:helix-turn-helix domain-containing protein [Microscilla marina]|uniref:Helix-turn-helix domain protein n=1 Tax=Microscilla marina ATCC 23134 TaxID=313606 RepID=A1ZV61_MICM2|nr:helix-turn-helix transcriptional regulator [Microscilla marina]EAY25717.1 helix-turn-helix domain protein [Microscilla marina ATCC 23134]
MSIERIKKKLKENSKKDITWIEKAKYRAENEAWLDVSFAIATKILLVLRSNKENNIAPKTQKELAEVMGVTPQYVNKVVKGKENLQLENIVKFEKALGIKLIEVPQQTSTLNIEQFFESIIAPKTTKKSESFTLVDDGLEETQTYNPNNNYNLRVA